MHFKHNPQGRLRLDCNLLLQSMNNFYFKELLGNNLILTHSHNKYYYLYFIATISIIKKA